MPKVTVAVPTYNRKDYLKDALTSILSQSYQDFEILVFDNASDFDIAGFLQEFNDVRIRLIRNEANVGNLQNLINIFDYKFASDYVIVFHDDDVMHPQLLETEVGLLEKNSNLAWANCVVNFIHDESRMFEWAEFSGAVEIVRDGDLVRWLFKRHANLSFDGALYRVNLLKSLKPYTESYFKWCDRPFMIDLADGHDVAIITDKLLNYRQHPNQDSKGEALDKLQYLFDLQKYYKTKLSNPLTKPDERLYYKTITNAMVISGLSFASTMAAYKAFIAGAKAEGLLKYKFLDARGAYYLAKVAIHYSVNLIKNGK
jgi:glycosyltransferase involved in cell wall biosynthesis